MLYFQNVETEQIELSDVLDLVLDLVLAPPPMNPGSNLMVVFVQLFS